MSDFSTTPKHPWSNGNEKMPGLHAGMIASAPEVLAILVDLERSVRSIRLRELLAKRLSLMAMALIHLPGHFQLQHSPVEHWVDQAYHPTVVCKSCGLFDGRLPLC